MKAAFILFCLFSLSFVSADTGGGTNCAMCTVVLQIVINLAGLHSDTFDRALENYCTLLPTIQARLCIDFAEEYGQQILEYVSVNANTDDICRSLGVCTDPTCNLFPGHPSIKGGKQEAKPIKLNPDFNLRERNAWGWLANFIYEWTSLHVPPVDIDGDFFSHTTEEFRGSKWRGKDCNALDNTVYPGRKTSKYPASYDQDCNGIHGSDEHGKSYENLYCANSGRLGYIGLGDSATAHFRVPPQWVNASEIYKGVYKQLPKIAFDELDWPHLSWGTGHLNDTTGLCSGPVTGIYDLLSKRNRCNFRDFQNIGVNGARVGSMAPPNGIINSMARNQKTDYPALVFFALIGNDVCNGHPTFDTMTTPSEFKASVLKSLNYLNTTLPAGSHVVFLGLAQGEFLWDTMSQREYIIGGTTYANFYDYLNCLEISPCWGWMNSNATIRALTSARARELSAVYDVIIKENTFVNFDMMYIEFPLLEVSEIWRGEGGQDYQLIEPFDGFHPSQQANSLFGRYLFEYLESNRPSFIGPINPHNEDIQMVFGDQGGY